MKEIWKDVKNYEGIYKVSNFGEVKGLERKINHPTSGNTILKGRIIKPHITNKGYFALSLYKGAKQIKRTVHSLVAESFLNHTPCGYKLVINHINHNSLDNRVENLEIVTQRENANLKHIKSTSKHVGVHWHKRQEKWISCIRINSKLKHLGSFANELDASNAYQKELKMFIC